MPEAAAAPPAPKSPNKSAPQKAMEKLSLVHDIDLALHLPLAKTVIAALAAAVAIKAGWQCVLMARTEILAKQHFSKLAGWSRWA